MTVLAQDLPDTANEPDLRLLYERYARSVYRRCQYFLRNDADAQDAMHDVFIKAVENWGTFRSESSPLTWLITITTHHCLNELRRKKATWPKRHAQLTKVQAQSAQSFGQHAMEQAQMVRQALERVDPKLRAAAVFYFVDDMSQQETADATGWSVPTLRKNLRRFIKKSRLDGEVIATLREI